MIQILKVTGESLSPFFVEGDFVVVSKIPFVLRKIKAGDIVVFRHPVYGTMIKKVEQISPDGEEIFVLGTHPESTDSRQFGPLRRSQLTGKVIWHIRQINWNETSSGLAFPGIGDRDSGCFDGFDLHSFRAARGALAGDCRLADGAGRHWCWRLSR